MISYNTEKENNGSLTFIALCKPFRAPHVHDVHNYDQYIKLCIYRYIPFQCCDLLSMYEEQRIHVAKTVSHLTLWLSSMWALYHLMGIV